MGKKGQNCMLIIFLLLFPPHLAKISWLTKDGFSHDEANDLARQGYYDEDGNWVYYDVPLEESVQQPVEPVQPVPVQPAQPQQPQFKPQAPQQQQFRPAAPAGQPAGQKVNNAQAQAQAQAQAAQAAQAAKAASAGLFKGLTSFGSGVKNEVKTQQAKSAGGQAGGGGGLFGGIMKAAASVQPPTPQQPPGVGQPQPKPKVKQQDPRFPKPCTLNMTPKQRWQWAYRRIVQVIVMLSC